MKKRKGIGFLIFLKISLSSLAASVSQGTSVTPQLIPKTIDQRVLDNEQGIDTNTHRIETNKQAIDKEALDRNHALTAESQRATDAEKTNALAIKNQATIAKDREDNLQIAINNNQQNIAANKAQQDQINTDQGNVNNGLRNDVDQNTQDIHDYQNQLTLDKQTLDKNTQQLAANTAQLAADKNAMDEFHKDFIGTRDRAIATETKVDTVIEPQVNQNTQGIAALQTTLNDKADRTELQALATDSRVDKVEVTANSANTLAHKNAGDLAGLMGGGLSSGDIQKAHDAIQKNTQDISALQGIVTPGGGATYANGQFAKDVQDLKAHSADIRANTAGVAVAKRDAANALTEASEAKDNSLINTGKISTLEAEQTATEHRLTQNEKDISSLQTDVINQGKINTAQDTQISNLEGEAKDLDNRLHNTEHSVSDIQTQLADQNNGLDSKSSKDQTTEGMSQIVGTPVTIDPNGHIVSGVDGTTIKNLKDLTTGQSVNAQAIANNQKQIIDNKNEQGLINTDHDKLIAANQQHITDNNNAQTTATSNEISRAKAAELTNQKQIVDNKNEQGLINTDHDKLIAANQQHITDNNNAQTTATSNEISRAKAAELTNQKQIIDNKNEQGLINTDHDKLIAANQQHITDNNNAQTTATSNEISRAKAAELTNQKQIIDNKNEQGLINTDHDKLIAANQQHITDNNNAQTTATSNEISRAKAAELTNQKQIIDNKNEQGLINTDHDKLIAANQQHITDNNNAQTTATSNEISRAKAAELINQKHIADNAKKLTATTSQVNNIGTLAVDKNGNPKPLIGKNSDKFDLTGSSGQLRALASAHNKNAQEIGDLKNLEHDKITSIYANDPLPAPPTPGSSSTVSSVPHANSNGEILQRGGQDLTVVKAINTLDSDILINHEDIIKLNDKTVKNTGEISDNKNNIAQNKSNINKLQSHSNSNAKHIQNNDKRITKNTQDIHHNTERINSVEAQMKKGIADAVAVAEIKYPKMEKGEMGIGAGYGTYESENAIAIGIGLQATDNLFINASVGATSGADDSVVGGAGVSYKFRVF